MRRKIVFLFGVIGVVALIALVVNFLQNRSPKQGHLRVDSEPTASVFLDNKHIGRTSTSTTEPFTYNADAGKHTIKLVPESAADQRASWEGEISIGQNLLTYVRSSLSDSDLGTAVDVLWLEKISSKKAELSVVTNPDGAKVSLDNETKGVTPLSFQDMEPTETVLAVTSPGFKDRELHVKLSPGYKLNASIKLALATGSAPSPEASPSPTPSGTPGPKASGTPKPTPTKTASETPDPPKPFVIIKDTPTGFLRVRIEPSTSASEAARVTPGEKYTVLDTQSGWYQIRYNDTDEGWIFGQYAEKVE